MTIKLQNYVTFGQFSQMAKYLSPKETSQRKMTKRDFIKKEKYFYTP